MGEGGSTVVDSVISPDGVNPVAGSAIHSALTSKMDAVLGGETGQVLTKTADGMEWKTAGVVVDGELNSASTNPVENRVLWSSLENMSSQLGNVSSLLNEL